MMCDCDTNEGFCGGHDDVPDKFPEPTFLYETVAKLSMSMAQKTDQFIISESKRLGINPLIVVQQSALIKELKRELVSLREQIAQEIEAARKRFVHYSKSKPLVDQLADASGIACFDLAIAITKGKTE